MGGSHIVIRLQVEWARQKEGILRLHSFLTSSGAYLNSCPEGTVNLFHLG
jgi:hypothetical protein